MKKILEKSGNFVTGKNGNPVDSQPPPLDFPSLDPPPHHPVDSISRRPHNPQTSTTTRYTSTLLPPQTTTHRFPQPLHPTTPWQSFMYSFGYYSMGMITFIEFNSIDN